MWHTKYNRAHFQTIAKQLQNYTKHGNNERKTRDWSSQLIKIAIRRNESHVVHHVVDLGSDPWLVHSERIGLASTDQLFSYFSYRLLGAMRSVNKAMNVNETTSPISSANQRPSWRPNWLTWSKTAGLDTVAILAANSTSSFELAEPRRSGCNGTPAQKSNSMTKDTFPFWCRWYLRW